MVDVLTIGITVGGVYALMALGMTLIFGVTRIFNFAHGSFFTWGAYLAWALHTGLFRLSYGAALSLTLLIMFLFGFILEKALVYPLRRFKEWSWSALTVTLGAALVLDNLALVCFGPRYKTLPPLINGNLELGGLLVTNHDAAMLLIVIAVVGAIGFFMQQTRDGLAMQAVAQDMQGAKVVGISVDRIFGYTFGISASLAALAGVLLAPRTLISPFVGWPVLIKAFVIVIFGGMGSIKGSVAAAFILGIIEAFVTYYIGAMWGLPFFLAVLLILLVLRPKGLFGKWGGEVA
jgi:branched-chain amino acid transport system permease protein